MIKPGYSLVVVAPPRGILTNQGLVAPSRGTKNSSFDCGSELALERANAHMATPHMAHMD